jgi:hypothetical protein
VEGNSGHRELCKYGFDLSGKVENTKYTTLVTNKQGVGIQKSQDYFSYLLRIIIIAKKKDAE